MINKIVTFSLDYYIYIRAILPITLNSLWFFTQTAVVGVEKNITSQKITQEILKKI